MISTVTHPRLGEVTLSRTRRARRISISVRGTGAVRVSFPYGVSVRRAMQFLDLKADWVEQARVRMAARMPAEPPLPPRPKPASKSCAGPPKPIFRRVSSGCRS